MVSRRGTQRHWRRTPSGLIVPTPLDIVRSVAVVDWFRADIGVSPGATLTWTGVKGTVASQSTAGKQPTLNTSDALFNGRKSFTFDGSNDEFSVALAGPAPGTSPRWYWFILRNIAISVPSFVLCGAGVTSHIIYRQGADAADQLSQFNGAKANTTSNATVGVARRVAVNFTNSVADYVQIGSAKTTGTNATNNSCASLTLGGDGAAGNFCNFALADWLICAGEPTLAERNALDSAYATAFYTAVVLA